MPQEAIEAGQRTLEHTWRIPLATSNRGEAIARWGLGAQQRALVAGGKSFGPIARLRLAVDDSGLASFDSTHAAEFAGWAAARDVWFDPTLVVIQAFVGLLGAGDSTELRYVKPSAMVEERAEPSRVPPAEELEFLRGVYARLMTPFRALVRGGAKFVAGTDVPVMPLVPGFALHHELAALVDLGLTPMQAIQAATRNAALAAIGNTRTIQAVMTRGRLLSQPKLDSLLPDTGAWAKGAP